MGGETIKSILKTLDLDIENKELRRELKAATTEASRVKIIKRLKVIESMLKSDNKPDWFMMDIVPVLPPDLRPLVPLEAGRFATSDLNDLYRRVINRNNRLKRLKELNAPEIIIRNEKKNATGICGCTFDNGRRGKVFTGANKSAVKITYRHVKRKAG